MNQSRPRAAARPRRPARLALLAAHVTTTLDAALRDVLRVLAGPGASPRPVPAHLPVLVHVPRSTPAAHRVAVAAGRRR